MFKSRVVYQSLKSIRLYSIKSEQFVNREALNSIINYKALEAKWGIPYIRTRNFLVFYHDKLSRFASNNYGLVYNSLEKAQTCSKNVIPYMFPLKYNPSPQFVSKVQAMISDGKHVVYYGTLRMGVISTIASFIYFSFDQINYRLNRGYRRADDIMSAAIENAAFLSLSTGFGTSIVYLIYATTGMRFIGPLIGMLGFGKLYLYVLNNYTNMKIAKKNCA